MYAYSFKLLENPDLSTEKVESRSKMTWNRSLVHGSFNDDISYAAYFYKTLIKMGDKSHIQKSLPGIRWAGRWQNCQNSPPGSHQRSWMRRQTTEMAGNNWNGGKLWSKSDPREPGRWNNPKNIYISDRMVQSPPLRCP